jgi:hypothetical protein
MRGFPPAAQPERSRSTATSGQSFASGGTPAPANRQTRTLCQGSASSLGSGQFHKTLPHVALAFFFHSRLDVFHRLLRCLFPASLLRRFVCNSIIDVGGQKRVISQPQTKKRPGGAFLRSQVAHTSFRRAQRVTRVCTNTISPGLIAVKLGDEHQKTILHSSR